MTDHPTSEAMSAGECAVCHLPEGEHDFWAAGASAETHHFVPSPPAPASPGQVLTRQKFEQHLIYYGNNAARQATHSVAMESEAALLAHDAALREKFDTQDKDWKEFYEKEIAEIAALRTEVERLRGVIAHAPWIGNWQETEARADAAEAALDVARTAIKEAAHGSTCRIFASSQTRQPDGTYRHRPEPCDCWKSRALAAADGKGSK